MAMSAMSPTPAEKREMICSFLVGRWVDSGLGDSFRCVSVAITKLPGKSVQLALEAIVVPGGRRPCWAGGGDRSEARRPPAQHGRHRWPELRPRFASVAAVR